MDATSIRIAALVQVFLFGGALLGLQIGRKLPAEHMTPETRTVVSAAMAVVGTMCALVISLLISSGNTSLKDRNAEVAGLSRDIVMLDTMLRRYGPEAAPVRDALRDYAIRKSDDLFPSRADARPQVDSPSTHAVLEHVEDMILAFHPNDDRQHWLVEQSLRLAEQVNEAQSLLSHPNITAVPLPFFGAVVLWLTVLFGSFGLFAPRNLTSVVSLFLCALAVTFAIKLIFDMDTPFEGVIHVTRPPIRISSEPMHTAVEALQR